MGNESWFLMRSDGSYLKDCHHPIRFDSYFDAQQRAVITNAWCPKNLYFPVPVMPSAEFTDFDQSLADPNPVPHDHPASMGYISSCLGCKAERDDS